MRKNRRGFTLVEVALFLGITGLLFMGIAAGVSGSLYQQRYNDSVQNFAEFLKSIYSKVSNTQGIGGGRSDLAIYGKLVTFGEQYDLKGVTNSDGEVFVYTVVGDADGALGADLKSSLKAANADVMLNGELAGIVEEYKPRWGAWIERAGGDAKLRGAVLVARHPQSGTVYTYVMIDDTIEVNKMIKEGLTSIRLGTLSNFSSFRMNEIDFCVDPEGSAQGENRRDVRIVKNARNAAGVEVIGADSDRNVCRR